MPTFGELIGAEMRARREGKGMTQLQVAQSAFGPDSEDRQIRRFENGEVKRPQAKTFQPICQVLDISQQRIGELKSQASNTKDIHADDFATLRAEKGSLKQALSDLKSLTRGQLETIATRFEIDGAYNLPDPQLVDLLSKKAHDYRTLRAEIDAINPELKRLSNLKAAAYAAIEDGDLEQVETLLSHVQEAELDEAAKTAELRANNALLRGKAEQAYRILSAAADSFAAISPVLPADKRWRWANSLHHHTMRYGGDGLNLSAQMNKDALSSLDQITHPTLWATHQNNLGIALADQANRTNGARSTDLLEEAVTAYRAALQIRTKHRFPNDWSQTQQNLSVALAHQANRTTGVKGTTLLKQAAKACRAALEIRTKTAFPNDWAMAQTNLGNILLDQAKRLPPTPAATLLEEAATAHRNAMQVHTIKAFPIAWAMAQNNLATTLLTQGILKTGAEGYTLLKQAVTAYRAALEVRNKGEFPVDWAMTQNNLSLALYNQGIRNTNAKSFTLLEEAITACRSALEVYTKDTFPVNWAITLHHLAMSQSAIARQHQCLDPCAHLKSALILVENALTVFDPVHMSYHYEMTRTLKTQIEAALEALPC